MRDLKRNQQTIHYKSLVSTSDVYDEYGNLTGEQSSTYGEMHEFKISVSGNKGDTSNQTFGVQLDYDRTMITSDMNCGIDENSVLWIDTDIDKPHNYIVKRMSKTLNQILYAIKRVDVT